MKYTKNSKSIVNGLEAGKLNWQVWKNLVLFLQNVMYLLKQIRLGFLEENLPTELALFYNQELMIAFNEIEKLILLYAEPITSEEDNKLRIINGVDDTLDELRIQYNNLEEVLQETTRIIAANFLEEVFNTVYIPQGFWCLEKPMSKLLIPLLCPMNGKKCSEQAPTFTTKQTRFGNWMSSMAIFTPQ